MEQLNLFPPEDTLIRCKTPDGQVIEVDAMDMDELVNEVFTEYKSTEIPTREYLKLVCEKFFQRYGYKMSRRSMDVLLATKTDILEKVKKNSYLESVPASSTESSQEQIEN